MHTEGQECMKVLKRVDKDLSSLGGKATRRKVELVALEKNVQKQNKKMLKLMERIDNLEELAEKQEKRIWALEEVEEFKPKVCQCVRVEEIDVLEEVKRGYRMHLKHPDPLLCRRPLVWSIHLRAHILMTWHI